MRVLVLCLLAMPALAASRTAYVLRIEGSDAFVDLGRAEAAQAGARLRLYRVVEARHPATGKLLRDRFLLGEAHVLEAGEALSRIGVPEELLARLEVGDEVEPEQPAPAARAAPSAMPPAAGTGVASDAERAALRSTWDAGLQAGPAERARLWEEFLTAFPQSDLTVPIRAEVALLRAAAAQPPREAAASAPPPPAVLSVSAPTSAVMGEPVTVNVTHTAGAFPRAAMLHWRLEGTPTYRTVHLRAEDTGHFRGALAPGDVQRPALEYYVEAVDAGGSTRAVAGSARRPHRLEVERAPGAERAEVSNRSRVRLFGEFVDFNRFEGNDTYSLLEADFLYRVFTAVHAVRVGFGRYAGRGTPRLLLDRVDVQPERVGFTYGFGEVELRLGATLATLFKVSAGVTREGLTGGLDVGLRIGSETGTSLLVRGASVADIGRRASLALAWDAVQGWPMSAEVIVTNEPIGEDLGVRLIYTLGRSLTPWLDVAGRVGYQLRDIDHSGLTLGLGTTFHW